MTKRNEKSMGWPAGSKFARPEDSVGFLLWQVLHIWQRTATAGLADLDLTHMQFTVLAGIGWLGRNGDAPIQSAVAAHCQLDAMTVSQIVRTLEKKGFVTREESEQDARAKAIRPTPHGTAALSRALPRIDEMDARFFGEADVERLMRELGTIYRARSGTSPHNSRENLDAS